MRVQRWQPLWMLGPSLALLGVFFVYPVFLALLYSFREWDLLTPPRWVGLANYRALFANDALLEVLVTTVKVSLTSVLASTGIGLALAVGLNRPGHFVAFVRSCVFSAYVVSWVSVALLWLWMLDADSGIVSAAAQGLGFAKLGLLARPASAPYAIALVIVWKTAGYAMVLFLAGLQSIPESVQEAAELDGASTLRRFWHVTWPLLGPTTAFVTTTSLIFTFQAFDVVRVMTQGGPVRSTTVFVYSIYEQMFLDLRVGRASAEVVVFFVILMALTSLQFWAFRRRGAL